MLKKIFLIILFIFINISNTFAIDINDEKLIKNLEDAIYNIYKEKWIDEIKKLDTKIEDLKLKNKNNVDNLIFLVKFSDILAYYINKEKIFLEENKINKLKKFHIDFVLSHWKDLDNYIEEKCIKNYDLIDEIAKKNNFPTELIIATWRKESSCNMINPKNWDWIFQIVSHYYEPWKINEKEFKQQINDFIKYTHKKWISFEKNKKLKEKFNQDNLNITYDNYTLKDLQIHAMLYNWVSKKYTLEKSKYTNWNLNEIILSKNDWIITLLIKILKNRYSM